MSLEFQDWKFPEVVDKYFCDSHMYIFSVADEIFGTVFRK